MESEASSAARGAHGAYGYKDLHVWRESVLFATEVYAIVSGFPAHERLALCDRIRRAAVSVAARIARGQGGASREEFLRQLNKAGGSLAELHTLLVLAEQLGYLSPAQLADLEKGHLRISRPLQGLADSVRAALPRGPSYPS